MSFLAPVDWVSDTGSGYRGTERQVLIRDRLTSPAAPSQRPLCLLLHGANQTAHDAVFGFNYEGTSGFQIVAALVATGFEVLAIDAGGVQNWGNLDSFDAIDIGCAWARDNYGANPNDGLHILSFSMGGMTTLNYRRLRNTYPVRGWAGVIPAINPQDIYARDAYGSRAFIDSVYASQGGWGANEPAYNPHNWLSTYADLPTQIWYSTDDPVCLPSYMAEVPNAQLTSVGAAGHSLGTTSPAAVASFLASTV